MMLLKTLKDVVSQTNYSVGLLNAAPALYRPKCSIIKDVWFEVKSFLVCTLSVSSSQVSLWNCSMSGACFRRNNQNQLRNPEPASVTALFVDDDDVLC